MASSSSVSSLSPSSGRAWLLIGNPENRRVVEFARTLVDLGEREPTILSHSALVDDPDLLLKVGVEPTFVRIDSVGESAEVEKKLLVRGADLECPEPCQNYLGRNWRGGRVTVRSSRRGNITSAF